jgi:hypothetical protein
MSEDLENLLVRYLDGSAAPEDVRRLGEAVCRDPAACRETFLAAAMEVHLARVLGVERAGAAGWLGAEAAAGPAVFAPGAGPRRGWARIVAYAAAVLVLVAVGVAASYYAARALRPAGTESPPIMVQTPEPAPPEPMVRQPPEVPPPPVAPEKTPPEEVRLAEVVSTKGIVRMIPPDTGIPVTVSSGAVVRPGARFWTCPEGGCSVKYGDGLLVGLNRNTTARLTQTDGAQRVELERGSVAVDGRAGAGARHVILASHVAEATLAGGDVLFSILDGSAVIEVADGEAQLTRNQDHQQITVKKGQYAVVKTGLELRSRDGRFHWHLEPARRVPEDKK